MRRAVVTSTIVALPRNRSLWAQRVARLRVSNLEIDALDRRITQGMRELRLSPSEHTLLYTLAAKRGAVVTYDGLADALGIERGVRANSLARHVTTLRRKLGDAAHQPRYIETVAGIGYRFVVPHATPS